MRTVIPILLYHSISSDTASGFRTWSLAPERFESHMRYLHDERYTPLTVSELVHELRGARRLPAKPIVISFDDGLSDFYSGAFPALKKYGMPSTLYVVSGCVGSTSRWLVTEGESQRSMLSWRQLRELDRAGVEIGAHSHSHPQLDTLPSSEAWSEILLSKCQIEDHLGHRVESFAYPHGYHSAHVRGLVQQAGFSSACAVKHAFSACDDDPFSLARIVVTNEITVAQLDRLLHGGKLQIAPRYELIRTRMWRLTRRSLRLSQRLIEWIGAQPEQLQNPL